jgi:hypothetical protein
VIPSAAPLMELISSRKLASPFAEMEAITMAKLADVIIFLN